MSEQIETSILFSDIRDFTEYTVQRGDQRALALVQAHTQIAEAHIRDHGGEVVKTYGDGVMVCFSDPLQAVSAAIEMQRDFNAHTQQYPEEPLLVGMGLHKGQVIRERGDLFGHAVNLAKRLSDEARCCQIIISKAVTDDLRTAACSFRWLDLGERKIRGLGKERLYEIVWRPESARLTTKDEALNLILTDDDKLVIELGKQTQAKLEMVQERLRAKAEQRRGLTRWLLKALEKWVPQWIDWALLKAGVGIEHDIRQVQMSIEQSGLSIQVGDRHPFRISGTELDPGEMRQFVQMIEAKRASSA
jgi:class 3 adenylate cyclase